MTTVLLRAALDSEDVAHLLYEFPHMDFLLRAPECEIEPELWAQTEVLVSTSLKGEELQQAPRLRWVHVPGPSTELITSMALTEQSRLLISRTVSTHPSLAGSFAIGAILSFSTGLHDYKLGQTPELPSSLAGQTLLQIGLGPVGHEITRHAKHFGMKVWGVRDPASFHPHCHKVFSSNQAHALLPAADVLCVCATEQHEFSPCLSDQELALTKEHAVIIFLCGDHAIHSQELEHLCHAHDARGILVDAHLKEDLSAQSPVRKLNNLVVTPGACTPQAPDKHAVLRSFHHNLRQFAHHNYYDMQALVQSPLATS